MNKRGVSWKLIIISIIVIAAVAIYFTFFFSYKCSDMGCFQSHQAECAKTKFVNDAEDGAWSYSIKGKSGNSCKINVELLQLKQGSVKLETLEGNKMDCYLPLGNTAQPESDLSKCHGLLKEELQAMIITRLHAHILENIGEIDEALKKPI